MQLCPHTGTRTPDQQTYGFAAVAQGHHEQSRATVFPALRISHHRTRPVIDLGLFSGCGLDNPYGLGLCYTSKLVNKTVHTLVAMGKAVIGDEVVPDRQVIPTTRETLLNAIAVPVARTDVPN